MIRTFLNIAAFVDAVILGAVLAIWIMILIG